MSHYSKIETQIVERDALVQALNDMGYQNIEIHEVAQQLYGYQGDLRPESAEVIVRRQYISAESNDIGFKKNSEGFYQAIISEYDTDLLGHDWIGKVCQKYAECVIVNKLKLQGFEISERRFDEATKRVNLVLRRS